MNTQRLLLYSSLVLFGVVFAIVLFVPVRDALGSLTLDNPAQEHRFRNYTFLNATTTTAVSTNVEQSIGSFGEIDNGYLDITGADRVTFYFSRGDTSGQGNTGSSVFDVDVSYDGTNWHDFNRLVANDTSATATSTTEALTGTTTVIYSMDLSENAFKAVRCSVTEVTDGEHTCIASASWD